MIAEAGFGGLTGFTRSFDLEGTTFIPSLALAHQCCATDLLNEVRQRHELSKKLAKRVAIFAPASWLNRTTAILPGPHASQLHPAPARPVAHTSRAHLRGDVAAAASNHVAALRVPARQPANPCDGQ